jgi:hypothetical protein
VPNRFVDVVCSADRQTLTQGWWNEHSRYLHCGTKRCSRSL